MFNNIEITDLLEHGLGTPGEIQDNEQREKALVYYSELARFCVQKVLIGLENFNNDTGKESLLETSRLINMWTFVQNKGQPLYSFFPNIQQYAQQLIFSVNEKKKIHLPSINGYDLYYIAADQKCVKIGEAQGVNCKIVAFQTVIDCRPIIFQVGVSKNNEILDPTAFTIEEYYNTKRKFGFSVTGYTPCINGQNEEGGKK